MSTICHLILSIVLLFASLSMAGADQTITPDKQAKYILYLYHALPEVLLSSGGMYSVDPLVAMKNERRFLDAFQTPEVQKVVRSEVGRPDYSKKIQVQVQAPENVMSVRITETERENLWKQFAFLGGKFQDDAQINSEIVSLVRSLKGQSYQGLLTGMVQSLPQELKAMAFKLPADEKARFVIQNITDQQLRASFRSNVYTPDTISVHFLINELQRMKDTETQIAILALFQEWKRSGSSESAFDELPELKPMQNEAGLSTLEKDTGIDSKDAKKVKETVQGLAQAYLKPALQQSAKIVWTAKSNFSIELMTPNLAIYRGILNGDCFTTYAYGFAYAPRERTFLVRDEEGKALMTVYSTEVMFRGKLSLYIHDMGSAAVSPTMGSLVFRAFDQIKQELGYAHVVLGWKGMHHGAFQQDAKNASEASTVEPIQHLDAQSRKLIGAILVDHTGQAYAQSHDLPSAHSSGYLFIPKSDFADRLSIQIVPKMQANPSQEITPSERRILVLQFLVRNRDALASAMVGAEHVNQIQQLKALLLNSQKQPLHQYYQSVKDMVVAIGLGWDENTLKENTMSLARGHLMASDAWQGLTSPVSKTTAEYAANLLKADITDSTVRTFLQSHSEAVQMPAFEKLFRSYLKDNAISLGKARYLSHFFRGQPMSSSLQESLYQVLDFQNYAHSYGFMQELMMTVPHTPTSEQMAKIRTVLVSGSPPQKLNSVLNMIAARPEMWQPSLINDLMGLRHLGRLVENILTKYDELQASMIRRCGSAHSVRAVSALSVFAEPIRSLFKQEFGIRSDLNAIFASQNLNLNLNMKNACSQ